MNETGNIMASRVTASEWDSIGQTERQARIELAIAYRLFDWLGITDLIHTHISIRVPDQPGLFLQLPYGHLFREARASQMVKCDVAGNVVSDPTGLGISRGGFTIHSAIHQAVPQAHCVMHAHTEASIAVSNYRRGLLPLSQHALRFWGKIGYLDYCGVFNTPEKCAALSTTLGNGDVLMLRNHGPLVVGPSVPEAWSRMYYLERACRMQVASLSQCTDPESELVYVNDEDCAFMARAFEGGESVTAREWSALVRMIDEINPGYDQ